MAACGVGSGRGCCRRGLNGPGASLGRGGDHCCGSWATGGASGALHRASSLASSSTNDAWAGSWAGTDNKGQATGGGNDRGDLGTGASPPLGPLAMAGISMACLQVAWTCPGTPGPPGSRAMADILMVYLQAAWTCPGTPGLPVSRATAGCHQRAEVWLASKHRPGTPGPPRPRTVCGIQKAPHVRL